MPSDNIELVREGDLFVVTEDTPMSGLVRLHAPASDGFRCIVEKGILLRSVMDSIVGRSTAFYAVPVEYEFYEKKLVPDFVRRQSKYWDYALVPRIEWIGTKLQRIVS